VKENPHLTWGIRATAVALLIAGCSGKNGILTVAEPVADLPVVPGQESSDSQEPPPPEPEVEPSPVPAEVSPPPDPEPVPDPVPDPVPAPFGNPPAPPSTRWVKVWGDEFDGSAIDHERWRFTPARWERRDRNQGPDCKVNWNWQKRDNVMVADGHLILRNSKVQSPPERYDGDVLVQAAAVYSRRVFERTYGYFEARIRIAPTLSGIHTAFWLTGNNAGGTEIDIVESANRDDSYHIALHWKREGDTHRTSAFQNVDLPGIHDGGFHVFAVHWHQGGYEFFVDGEQVWQYSGEGVSHVDEFIYLSTGVHWKKYSRNACNGSFPNEARVDWVRVWEATLVE
jgi:beta-glucanase (GH16 family)